MRSYSEGEMWDWCQAAKYLRMADGKPFDARDASPLSLTLATLVMEDKALLLVTASARLNHPLHGSLRRIHWCLEEYTNVTRGDRVPPVDTRGKHSYMAWDMPGDY